MTCKNKLLGAVNERVSGLAMVRDVLVWVLAEDKCCFMVALFSV